MELKRLGSTTSWKAYTHQPMMVSSRLGPGEEMDGLDIKYLLENAAALELVEKPLRAFPPVLQSAARIICSP